MKLPVTRLASLVAALAAPAAGAAAPVALAPQFRDHAVLQRDVPVPIRGTAEPGATVQVRLVRAGADGAGAEPCEATAGADADGRWRVELPPHPAGGPYELLVSAASPPAGAGAVAEDILFGDVWICAGGSGMASAAGWPGALRAEAAGPGPRAGVRLFRVPRRASLLPLRDLPDDCAWTTGADADDEPFSAVGRFFGEALREAMPDVPIGLVQVAWPGSTLQSWIPLAQSEGVGGDLGRWAAAHRRRVEAWTSGGRERYRAELAAWTDSLGSIDPGDAPAAPDFDDSDWRSAVLPEIAERHVSDDFDGWVWYRRTFAIDGKEIPCVDDATLELGPIDDQDRTYVNGVLVGSTNVWDAPRRYEIPGSLLRPGTNTIAVKVLDWGGHAGFWNDSSRMALTVNREYCDPTDDGEAIGYETSTIPLGGEWRFRAYPAAPRPKDLEDVGVWDVAACHNGMVAPLLPMAARGAIWKQGNADLPMDEWYERRFPALVAAWRADFSHGDRAFPVYLAQLAPGHGPYNGGSEPYRARQRWVQAKLGESIPDCGTAVTPRAEAGLHPADTRTVGERLARLALARAYGDTSLVESGPIPEQAREAGSGRRAKGGGGPLARLLRTLGLDPARRSGGTVGPIVILFRNADGLATADGKPLRGFQLRDVSGGMDGGDAVEDVKAAIGSLSGRPAVVIPRQKSYIAHPTHVRYAWDDDPDGNLVNGARLPCTSFELPLSP